MKRRELTPADGRKSFYGKCFTLTDDAGNETLYSYNTAVMIRTAAGNLERIWSGWSATTGRHIAAFCGLNKKGFTALPYAK
jgi:hypothetical protein